MLTMDDEDFFKYLDIAKKSLSGSLGNNLFNLDFPLDEEKIGGKQQSLMALRDSDLADEDMLTAYYVIVRHVEQTQRRRMMMEEIKNLMETIQKENKNAIVVWSENTANGLSVSIQMNGKTESFMTMALHMICSIAVTMDVTPVEMLDTFKQLCADNPEAINDVMETLKRDLPADMPS